MQNKDLTMHCVATVPIQKTIEGPKISPNNKQEDSDEISKPIVWPLSIKTILKLKKQKEDQEKKNKELLEKEILLKFSSKSILMINDLIVCNFQANIFTADKVNFFDKLFLTKFVQRKLGLKKIDIDLEVFKRNPQSIDEILNNLLTNYSNGHSTKTTQQNMQFIYKTAMKFMRFKLMEKNIIKHHFCHLQFYNYYFRETADYYKMPLEEFYDPRNMNLKNRKKQTFNKKYLLKTALSQKFRNDLCEFMRQDIFHFYQRIANKRVLKLIDSVEKEFIKLIRAKDLDKVEFDFIFDSKFRAINKVLVENPQNKLPWSSFEIRQAIQQVISIFTTQQSQKQSNYTLTAQQ